jgi:uncharacterized protein
MTAIFVDTGAGLPGFVPSDPDHAAAREWFERNTHPLTNIDYIVDELSTVLKVRGEFQRSLEVGPALFNGEVCEFEWITQHDIKNAWRVFAVYRDKEWSFTDCVGLAAMERLAVTTAMAFDEHFRQFGTVTVVP